MLFNFAKKRQQANKEPTMQVRAATSLRIILPVIVLLICWIITFFIWNAENTSSENKLRTYFEYRARDVKVRIEQRITSYEQILRSASGLFNASTNINRTEFHTFFNSLRLDKNYQGFQGLGFTVIIPPEKIKEYVLSIRREGFPEYKIWPEGSRKIYTSIIYLEPFRDINLRAFGYDMYSEPVRRKAMETSRDLNDAIISGKVRLVQETGKAVQSGFLIYLPIYRNGKPHTTISERRSNIIGWVYSPFRMNDFITGLFGENAADLDVEIYDSKNISSETKMYDSNTHATKMDQPLVLRKEIDFIGHKWTVLVKSTPQVELRMGLNTARVILIVGFSISLLLTLITWLLVNKMVHTIITNAEHKRMAEELKESEEHFRSVAESANEAIITSNSKGIIFGWNLGAETIFGYTDAEIVGKNLELLIPLRYLDKHINGMKRVEDGGEHHVIGRTVELHGLHKSGKEFPLELSLAGWETTKGKFFTGILRDITERKQTEEKIKNSNEQLIILNAEKDKFFSIIAHDLKSPFSGFLNLTELMADGKVNYSQAEIVENSKALNKAARTLYKLLDNLLEWSQLQRGAIKFTPKISFLSKMIEGCIDTINQRAVQKNITIVNEVPVSLKVFVDDKMINTVLRNLLSNAVKFTRQNGKVMVRSAHSDNGTIEISVIDNGVGIPAKDVKRLFNIEEKFRRKGTDGEDSTGLGLLLCKEFVDKHGGKIWVESKENEGSTFSFTLPIVH